MTANELANLLEDDVEWTVALNSSLPERLIKAAKMLRNQAEEIVRLKLEWQHAMTMLEKDALINGIPEIVHNQIQADAIRWLAQEHWDECKDDRPVQDWMRSWADLVEQGWIKKHAV